MKKLLFLSNGSKPSEEDYNYIGEEKLSNFSIPIVNVAQSLGVEVTVGVNRRYAEQLTCMYPVSFYDAQIYRNPFNLMEIYQAYKNACAEISKGGYSVVHCNTPIGGVVGRIAGRKFKLKVVYTAHGFHFYKGAPLFNRTVLKWIEMIMARWTDVIITMNQEDYEAAKKFKLRKGGNVYFVHGVGITLSDFEGLSALRQQKRAELGVKDDDIVLISMGDLVSRKNYGTAIRAIAKANNSRLQYYICGKGPELENLQSLAKELAVEEQVHFLGFRTDVKELLAGSDIFLFTTLQEGLPRSMMEAMASGLPCIASKIRGNTDLLENTEGGYLCDAGDASAYAEKINLLADDKDLREKMGENNLYTIKKYSVETVTEEIRNIYKTELNFLM